MGLLLLGTVGMGNGLLIAIQDEIVAKSQTRRSARFAVVRLWESDPGSPFLSPDLGVVLGAHFLLPSFPAMERETFLAPPDTPL